jgi:hypothetical protein
VTAGQPSMRVRVLSWVVAGVLGCGIVVMCAGPHVALREARRQLQGAGIGRAQKPTVETLRWTVPKEELMAAVKTATTRTGAVVTGTLSLTNQRTPSNSAEGPGPSWGVAVTVGNIHCFLSRMFYDNDAGEWSFYVYYGATPQQQFLGAYDPGCTGDELPYIYGVRDSAEESLGTWPGSVVVKIGTGVSTVSVDYSITVNDSILARERTSAPATGRDGSPVYAHETATEDAWVAADPPWTYAVTLGTISWSGTQEWDAVNEWWEPNLSDVGGGIGFDFCQNGGTADTDYASIALQVGGIDLNFDHRHKTYGVFDLQGAGDTVTCHCETTGAGPSPASSWHIGYEWPRMIDFTGFHVKDRQGADVDGVRIAGPFQASPRVPASLTWSTTP